MKFIRGLRNINPLQKGCVLTIGNFDGVHTGHQVLLRQLHAQGLCRDLPVVVMIFEPQPLEFFKGQQAPARLTRLREKLIYLQQAGVDQVLCISFDKAFSHLSADHFISDILVEKLGVKFLAVGDDFRFGAGRQGDFLLLKTAGQLMGFEVINTRTYCYQGQRVSSTAIRSALANNDFVTAERLAGRPYSLNGRVIYGDALGRQLGFPTANILLKRRVSPVKGVFAVEVGTLKGDSYKGVANIGTRPTIQGVRQQLEVHLFDVQKNLYGQYLQVILRHKIRDEQRFGSLQSLQTQIAKDVAVARDFFGLQAAV